MALDGTYTGLKASVADFLNRADLTASIPDFIVLAEAQMARRFVSRSNKGMSIPRRLILRSDASFATNAEYAAVPTDIMGPINLHLTASDGTILDLAYLSQEALDAAKAARFSNGIVTQPPYLRWPKYYTVVGSELQIFPIADQAYTAELIYIKRMPAASTATNWILTDYPDAYLYGALTASAPYLKDDGRTTVWGTLFTSAIDDICESDPMPSNKVTLRADCALTRYRNQFPYTLNTNT